MKPLILFLSLCALNALLIWHAYNRTQSDIAVQSPWLDQHWSRHLSHQGEKPTSADYASIRLSPESCGMCHPQQFADWSQSRHSKAVGPGLLGQYADQPDLDEFKECLGCHAPLAEQADSVGRNLGRPGLLHQGLVCAACHLRQWHVKGPLPQAGKQRQQPPAHGGFEAREEFENPLFCAACHQFPEGGYSLNQKPLENTYAEWKNSSYAKQGITCQKCHMPERRHLWRGIHDPKMVRQGLLVSWDFLQYDPKHLLGQITLLNQGAGHALPTYVTPLIQVSFVQLGNDKQPLDQTYQEAPIGRMVSLDIETELFDTRLLPGEKRQIQYKAAVASAAKWLHVEVRVKPDEFYRRFYVARLKNPNLKQGRLGLTQALKQAVANEYVLWERDLLL